VKTIYVCKECGAELTMVASVMKSDCIEVERCGCIIEEQREDAFAEGRQVGYEAGYIDGESDTDAGEE